MKKLIALISVLALLLALCACSSQVKGAEGEGVPPGPEASSQNADKDSAQDVEPGEEPAVIPIAETKALEPSEEPQPPVAPPETSAPAPEPDPAPESNPAQAPGTAPAPDPAPAEPPASAPTPAPSPEPEPNPVPPSPPEPVPVADPKTTAQGLIGRPVSELYAAIGKPISSDYAPGCLEPDSEDGELIYSGFTVYTVRTATREYVYDVL